MLQIQNKSPEKRELKEDHITCKGPQASSGCYKQGAFFFFLIKKLNLKKKLQKEFMGVYGRNELDMWKIGGSKARQVERRQD